MNDYNRGALPDPCLRLDYGFGEEWVSVELGDGTGYVRLADYEKTVAENAKLRELVSAFWWCTENFDNKCSQCPLEQSSNIECECEVIMRELGISPFEREGE